MSTFTDSHCHLDFNELALHFPEVISNCEILNIRRIIVPAIGPKNWQRVLALSSNSSDKLSIYPCLGIHPWFLDDISDQDIAQLTRLIQKHRKGLVALGEAGIDGTIAKEKGNLTKQIQVFEQQLALANTFQLPIIVHHRRSHAEIYPVLKNANLTKGGVIHAFSGSYQQALQYINLGFKLGIGGTITYPRAEKTIKAIKKIPLDSLLLETDAPAMPISGFQGQPNHPKHLIDIFQHLCAIRREDKEQIAAQIELNIDQLFGLTR